jgi:hypothetical protein
MVLSLSPGPAIIEEAWHLEENANLWRITDDFWDRWDLLKAMFTRCEVWQSHVKPGCWLRDEQLTMMSLWCIFRSPLFMGGELTDNDDWTLSLLTNEEALSIIRFGTVPRQIKRGDNEAVWTNRTENALYLGLFNLGETQRDIRCPLSSLGLNKVKLRDVWSQKVIGTAAGEIIADVPPHGVCLLSLKEIP